MVTPTRVMDAPSPPGSAPRGGRRRGIRRTLSIEPFDVVTTVVALSLIVIVAYPVLRVAWGVVWIDGGFSARTLRETLAVPDLGTTLLHTALVVGASATCALILGGVLAWLNEKTDARMGVLTDILPIVNFLVPLIASAIGWVLLLSPRAGYLNVIVRDVIGWFGVSLDEGPFDAHSWPAVILVYTLGMVPFVFLVVSAGLRNLDPSLEEQSSVSGASVFTTLRHVTFPALRPSFLGASFLVIMFGLSVYSVPLVLAEPAGIRLMSVRIVNALTLEYPPATGAAVGLGAVIVLILGTLWLVQRRSIRSQRFGVIGGKANRTVTLQLKRWRAPARALMLLYIAVALVLPVGALVAVTLNGYWGAMRWDSLGLGSLWDVLTDRSSNQAIRNSLLLASVTATIAIPLASIVAWISSRSTGKFAQFVGGLIKLPAAISSVVIALGFVLAFAGPPFWLAGTLTILLLAYIAVTMPEASVTSEAALGQVGHELGEASTMSGASQARTLGSVYLPLMLPGLAAGWALVFVRVVGDLEVAALLAGTGTPAIGFEIRAIFNGSGGFAQLAALAMVITTISSLVLMVVLGVAATIGTRRT